MLINTGFKTEYYFYYKTFTHFNKFKITLYLKGINYVF